MFILTLIRALLWSVFFVLHTAVLAIAVVLASYVLKWRPFFEFIMTKAWSKWPLNLAGVQVEVRGAERLQGLSGGCLFLFSHSSLIDILVLFGYLPKPFMFGSKIELFRVPIFGPAMKRMGALPIARDNRAEVLKVYAGARQRVKAGESFALAPEGTRQDQGTQLGSFKKGPFYLAVQAQAPIVPVLIAGAHDVLPKKRYLINLGRWRRKVILQILSPISVEGLGEEHVGDLVQSTRETMVSEYSRLNRELVLESGLSEPLP